jgi:hypothetical protein
MLAADPWAVGWDALVAVGTLSLAVVTGILAFLTKRVAAETRDLAAATQADVAAQFRPIVAPARLTTGVGSPGAWAYGNNDGDRFIGLTNIGHGPALNVGVWYIGDHPRHNPEGDLDASTLAVDCPTERARLRHPVRLEDGGGFRVYVQYTSIGGDRYHSGIEYAPGDQPGEITAELVEVKRLYREQSKDWPLDDQRRA